MLIVRDIAGNLNQIEELVRSLDTQTPQVLVEARIVEATSRYLRDVGIQWGGDATFSAATGNPTGLAFPNSVGVAGGAQRRQTRRPRGLSPVHAARSPNPNFAVNLPATVGTGHGGALGLTLRLDRQHLNLARAPLGRRVERHAAHHVEPAHPHARQPRGAHQPGHADPVLADQRAGRADDVPGSEAPAPGAART